jgi:hypothetical protein
VGALGVIALSCSNGGHQSEPWGGRPRPQPAPGRLFQ